MTGSTRRALVVADLPFGSYQESPEQCFATSARFMKEAGAHAVKLEGGTEMVPQIEKLAVGGIPVMAHIGFTPQAEHQLGGYRVQGRGDAAQELLATVRAVEAAGAFAVVLEMVPGQAAAAITETLSIPTIGIGAGADCDAQVLVWQDMAGLRGGRMPRFVKQHADLRSTLLDAARAYASDVESGAFPAAEHTFSAAPGTVTSQRVGDRLRIVDERLDAIAGRRVQHGPVVPVAAVVVEPCGGGGSRLRGAGVHAPTLGRRTR
ncbi:3-methyl-2-oxobutanoate hydroxymethyltransferase [Brevibacterium luteolum]|nr:3-methyl-2-oxobutanoate hydroxymethyltransferase [Brevibacterium luteolum]